MNFVIADRETHYISPEIRLEGQWLKQLGFKEGNTIKISKKEKQPSKCLNENEIHKFVVNVKLKS